MADENEATVDAQTPEPTEEPKAPEDGLEHWKSMSRRNERAAKDAARERDAMTAERDKALADLEAANAQLAQYAAAAAHEQAVRKVSQETGLPESIVRGLRGETAEELATSAGVLKAHLGAYPRTRDRGEVVPVTKKSTADLFAEALDGIL